MKLCSKCGSNGPFYKGCQPDGLDYYCKRCRNLATTTSGKHPIRKLIKAACERIARLEGKRGRIFLPHLSPGERA